MSDTLKDEREMLLSHRDGLDEALDFIEECQEVLREITQAGADNVGVDISRNVGMFVEVVIEAYFDDPSKIPSTVYDFPGDSSLTISEQRDRYKVRLNERKSY